MGIGMKTRTPSQGTFNQEPKKKREDPPQKRRNTTQPQQQKSQSQLQSRPQKEVVRQEVEELLMPIEVVIQLEMHNGTL